MAFNPRNLPKHFTKVEPADYPPAWQNHEKAPSEVWVNRDYLVQVYEEAHPLEAFRGMKRLSVCRTKHTVNGWQDGLTWDELQDIKTRIGFGDWYGLELYPPTAKLVNVANFRHLWLLPIALPIGWGFIEVYADESGE